MRIFFIIFASLLFFPCLYISSEQQVPEGLITNFQVMDETNKKNWSIKENIQEGDLLFGDREYVIASLPEAYRGMTRIITACDSKQYTGETLVSFTVNADVTVFVVYDNRLDRKPGWFVGFKDTGDDLVDSETSPVAMSIFGKTFEKGSVVSLGPNTLKGQTGGCIQYSIIIMDPQHTVDITYVSKKEEEVIQRVPWTNVTAMPVEWYKTEEALRIGDNILLYQRDTGGWPKNIDMSVLLNPKTVEDLKQLKNNTVDSTIDNGATIYQITYLGNVNFASGEKRFKEGALAGLEYLLKAQYPNGGWPMVYPLPPNNDFTHHITFKNNAMINVLELFSSILSNNVHFRFVNKTLQTRIKRAADKGLECILASQIKINGKLTAWSAQYDPITLKPAKDRAHELPSISGLESVGIVLYLMRIEKPSPAVIDAVQTAVAWFNQVKIDGIRIVKKQDPALSPAIDMIVEADSSAPPVWGQFYDPETGEIFFSTRNGVKKATLAEIEHERRIAESFYTYEPAHLLNKVYPEWQSKYAPGINVLK